MRLLRRGKIVFAEASVGRALVTVERSVAIVLIALVRQHRRSHESKRAEGIRNMHVEDCPLRKLGTKANDGRKLG